MVKKKVVIIGGGLAGLSAGWVLSKQNFEVHVVEKESYLGGLAITRSEDGYSWDLGPHNIHTGHKHILSFLKRTFSGMYEHSITCQIFKNHRFVPYPIQGAKVLTSLPPFRLLAASFSLLVARVKMFLLEPSKDHNFEAWIKNRFGNILFQEYFSDYPRKVWGVPTDKIDRYVAEKRIPVISIIELIRTTLLGRKARIDHPEFKYSNYYLPKGIGEMCDFFIQELEQLGARLHLNSELLTTTTDSNKAVRVEITGNGETKSLDCDYLLSTIPVNSFIQSFTRCDEKTTSAAGQLDYVSSVLLFLKVSKKEVLPSKLLYFSSPEIKFSRVSDMAMFSSAMVPEGHSLLCFEFPCNFRDATWNAPTSELESHSVSILRDLKLLDPNDVIESFAEHVSHSYPRFKTGFREKLGACTAFLSGFSNLLSYGRQGGFSYSNTDNVIHQGFHAADAVVIADSMGYSCFEWFNQTVKS